MCRTGQRAIPRRNNSLCDSIAEIDRTRPNGRLRGNLFYVTQSSFLRPRVAEEHKVCLLMREVVGSIPSRGNVYFFCSSVYAIQNLTENEGNIA